MGLQQYDFLTVYKWIENEQQQAVGSGWMNTIKPEF
jgi:hypothetical protein